MKNNISFLLILLSLGFSFACSELDYDNYEKVDKTFLVGNARVYLPISNSKISFNLGKELVKDTTLLSSNIDGYMVYKIDNDTISSIEVQDEVSPLEIDETVNNPIFTRSVAEFAASTVGQTISLDGNQKTISIGIQGQADIDSIYYKSGYMRIKIETAVQADVEVSLSCEQIQLNGESNFFTKTLLVPYDGTTTTRNQEILYDLSGAFIDLSFDNPRENLIVLKTNVKLIKTSLSSTLSVTDNVSVNLFIPEANPINIGYGDFSSVDINKKIVKGIKQERDLKLAPVSVSFFSDLKERLGGATFEIRRGTTLNVKVENSSGLSLSADVSLQAKNITDGSTKDLTYGTRSSIPISADRSEDYLNSDEAPEKVSSDIILDDLSDDAATRTNFNELWEIFPDSIFPQVTALPIKTENSIIPQFVHEKSEINVVLSGEILFDVKFENFKVDDTVDFDVRSNFSDIFDISDSLAMRITYIIQNTTPLEFKIKPYYMNNSLELIQPMIDNDPNTISLISVPVNDDGENTENFYENTATFDIIMSRAKYNKLVAAGAFYVYSSIFVSSSKNEKNELRFVKLKKKYNLNVVLKAEVMGGLNYKINE